MKHDEVRVKARIQFLSTGEGGRSATLEGASSYRPNHSFSGPEDDHMCIGFIELMEGERIAPGDVIEKTITLLASPAVEPEIRQGGE